MSNMRSGLLCIGVAVGLQILGRIIISAMRPSTNVVLAGLMTLWMFVSVVLILFGLYRLMLSFLSKDRPAPPS